MDLEPGHMVYPPLRNPRFLARHGARVGVCPYALRRRLATSRSVGPTDRRRSQSRQGCVPHKGGLTGGAGHSAAETAASTVSTVTGEPGFADPLLQHKRDPHAL